MCWNRLKQSNNTPCWTPKLSFISQHLRCFFIYGIIVQTKESSELLGMERQTGLAANAKCLPITRNWFVTFHHLICDCRAVSEPISHMYLTCQSKQKWIGLNMQILFFHSRRCCWFSVTCWKKSRFSLLHCWSIRFGFYCSILVGVSTKKRWQTALRTHSKQLLQADTSIDLLSYIVYLTFYGNGEPKWKSPEKNLVHAKRMAHVLSSDERNRCQQIERHQLTWRWAHVL